MVLHSREAPRVRVVLDVILGSEGGKVVVFDPDAKNGVRYFLSSRVATLAWEVGASSEAVASKRERLRLGGIGSDQASARQAGSRRPV